MSWIKRKWSWAKQKPLFWWNIVFAATLVAVIWLWPAPNAPDLRVRLLGMALQLVGIVTVWLDLTDAARHFGKGGPLSFFVNSWEWLKIGIFGQKRIAVSSCAEAGYDIFAGRGKLRQPIDPSAPVLERVTTLEVSLLRSMPA